MRPGKSTKIVIGAAVAMLASSCYAGGFDAMGTMQGRPAAYQMAQQHGEIVPAAAKVPTLRTLARRGWTATASDSQKTPTPYLAKNVLDGKRGTVWESRRTPAAHKFPHTLTIDMKKPTTVSGLMYLPAQNNPRGRIGRFQISISSNGKTFKTIATGTWADDKTQKTGRFATVTTRYVRLTALSEAGHRGPWTTVAELNVLAPVKKAVAPAPPKPPVGPVVTTNTTGSWGPLINFPIVPVSAVLLPGNKLLTFSAYSPVTFSEGGEEKTQTAILDLNTGAVSEREVSNTGQEMFCEGIALLPDGRVLVNGGSDSGATSIYSPVTDSWTAGPAMNIPRGYEGDATLSTGQVFTLGGSWNGGIGGKNGEVFTPNGTWTLIPNVQASSMLTQDAGGLYRSDNLGWFFATANGGVFQAGPSKQMNWYTTAGAGTTTAAGNRAGDNDAMNGNAVMYDVGKIFTDGGAPDFENSNATSNAYTIDISQGPGKPVTVTKQASMTYARAFQNSVVLPNGEVLVIGGQNYDVPFTDTGAVMTPELWNPATGTFALMAAQAVPRTYHSVALLLPDGRVFSGGGGLCGDSCTTNHPDGQIFTPPYLLNADGSLRARPTIVTAPGNAAPGSTIKVITGQPVTGFDLVRYGAVTHSVDNDQRRIPVTMTATGADTYQVAIPASTGTVIPGNYMLFAMDANGTPSVSTTITIS